MHSNHGRRTVKRGGFPAFIDRELSRQGIRKERCAGNSLEQDGVAKGEEPGAQRLCRK